MKSIVWYVLFPWIGFAVIAFVWSGFDKMTFIFGCSWMLIGIIIGAIKSKGYKELPPTL